MIPSARSPKLSTALRGYGGIHPAIRKQLAPTVAAGIVRCARGAECLWAEVVDGALVGGLIQPGEAWDLGHLDGSGKRAYAGPEHRRCNRSAGAKLPTGRKVSRAW